MLTITFCGHGREQVERSLDDLKATVLQQFDAGAVIELGIEDHLREYVDCNGEYGVLHRDLTFVGRKWMIDIKEMQVIPTVEPIG